MRVGIIPWGDTIEDYLDPIGLDVAAFAERLTEGWLFGYASALRKVGVETVIVMASDTVRNTTRSEHQPTGSGMVLLPPTRVSRWIRRWLGDPQGRSWVGWPPRRAFTAIATAVALPRGGLGEVVDEERLDALIVQEYEYPRFDVLARWGQRRGLPVFGTFQGSNAAFGPGETWIRRRTMVRATGVLVPARAEIQRLRRCYNLDTTPATHVRNPIDLGLWPPLDRGLARAARGIDPEMVTFVCHGRIDVHRKGLDILVEAWASSENLHTRAQLILIGDGDGAEDLESLLSSAPPSIRWERGFLTSRSQLREWLSASDVFVSASRVEGMAVAPIEAMASSLPVVLSDVAGSLELADDNGEVSGAIIVPVGDVQALADAMLRLAASPERREELGRAARRTVETRCSSEVVGARLREAIEAGVHP